MFFYFFYLNIGNNQTGEGFWKQVLPKFLDLMGQGPYRDLDSVSSKWRKMQPKLNRFSEIHNRLSTSSRRSGMSDDDVFKAAMDKFQDAEKKPFQHIRAWEVVRTSNKWAPVPNEVEMAKRQRTSESGSFSAGSFDARCQINLNDDAEFDDEEYAVREEERPTGRDKSKKAAASKGKEKASKDQKMDAFLAQFKEYTEVTAQKAKVKERAVEERARASNERSVQKEWDILTADVDTYPEEKRAALKKLQETIMRKYE